MEKDSDKSIMKDINGRGQLIEYTNKTILDYICGNDVIFNVVTFDEEGNKIIKQSSRLSYLESDANFMSGVLKHTKDKKILSLCSKKLLKDPTFICGVMDIFSEDKLYCIELSNKLIAKNHNKYYIDLINMALKAKEINEDKYGYEFAITGMYLYYAYQAIKDNIEKKINKMEGIEEIHFNFKIVANQHPNNKPYLKYMATNMIDDIFESIESLEYYVKKNTKNTKYIGGIGARQYILEIIRARDAALADYAEIHQDIIANRINELNNIMIEWKTEELLQEEEIFKIIQMFSEQHIEISIDTCLKYIADSFGITSLLDRTYETMNCNLMISGYEIIDATELNEETVDEIQKRRLLLELKNEVLAYCIKKKKQDEPTEKILDMNNLRLIRACKEKEDI